MCSRQNHTYQQLIRARAFIDECYDLPLDLEQIAGQASFSRYHFLRLFRNTFDQTPHQYLVQRRIERAKALLAAGDLSITEVCFGGGCAAPREAIFVDRAGGKAASPINRQCIRKCSTLLYLPQWNSYLFKSP